MRPLPFVLLALGASGVAQTLEADPQGSGYLLRYPNGSAGSLFDFSKARTRPVPMGRYVWRWSERPRETPGVGAGVLLDAGRGKVAFPENRQLVSRIDRLPEPLLGATGLRLREPSSGYVWRTRILVPQARVLPPQIAPGARFFVNIAPDYPHIHGMEGKSRPPATAVRQRIFTLVRPDAGGWIADLDGMGHVRLNIDPRRDARFTRLAPEPGAWRYVGREFWTYPNSVEAFSQEGDIRATAILDRRKVRVVALARVWASGQVFLSGPLWTPGDEMSSAGFWPALHPLIAIVEPVRAESGRADPVRVSLVRNAVAGSPVAAAKLIEFDRPETPRNYVIAVADFWHLDRCLNSLNPLSAMGDSRQVRTAVVNARPIPGMTPAQVAWAIGWPNDPMTREELERFRDGTWEYPTTFGWNAAEFRDGRLVRYGPARL